jgi:outer membrane protein insertion porin family
MYDGLTKVRRATLDSYLRFKSSDPYTQNAMNETKRLLLRSGLFSRVEIEPSDGKLDQSKEKMTIRVVERPLKTLEVGGGANSEFGLHVFGEAIDKSLFADGQSIALRLDSYFSNSDVDAPQSFGVSQGFSSIRYVNPNIFGSDFSFSEELRYQLQDATTFEFNQDRLSLASYFYTSLSREMTLSAGHTVLLDDLSSVTPSAVLSPLDQGTTRLGFLSAVLAVDKRDDPLMPQEGFTLTLEPKIASKVLGSEADYASMIARSSIILPLDKTLPRFSLGLSGAVGAAFTYGDTAVLPITQRYYLGGRTTVRGFRENSLGPRAADGAVLGGDTLLMLKSQLQYLATSNITTHVFLDAGNVFLREESFDLSDTRSSAGVGFRFLSPIGPLGIDVGHPLDERGGEPSFRVHFSVGSAF